MASNVFWLLLFVAVGLVSVDAGVALQKRQAIREPKELEKEISDQEKIIENLKANITKLEEQNAQCNEHGDATSTTATTTTSPTSTTTTTSPTSTTPSSTEGKKEAVTEAEGILKKMADIIDDLKNAEDDPRNSKEKKKRGKKKKGRKGGKSKKNSRENNRDRDEEEDDDEDDKLSELESHVNKLEEILKQLEN